MKLHKKGFTVLLLALSVSIFAQIQDKKFTETFNVNKDVVVEIEASNTEIDVTTWNKNQVLVEAYIEIEGLSKKEAEKYFKKLKFEALGNKSKVKISFGGNSFHFGNKDFVMFDKDFKMPEIVIPDFKMPNIEIPEMDFDFENIVIPEINMDKIFLEIEDIDWDKYSKEGKEYFFKWKKNAKEIKIKSKKEWEAFKKTKEYKEWKSEMEKEVSKMKKEMAKMKDNLKFDKEKMKKEIADAMKSVEKIDMSKIKEEMAKVSKEMKEMKFDYLFDFDKGETTFNGKKVKIKKRVTIKVPKGATFDLNTRHCKIKLPKTKASGKVSYGSFNADELNGGELKIYSSPASINVLNSSTLSFNNVTDATLASVTNSKINSDSSDLKITKAFSGVFIKSSFGNLIIENLETMLMNFQLVLNQSDATINVKGLKESLKIISSDIAYKKKNLDKGYTLNGKFSLTTNNKSTKIEGNYSSLTLLK